MGMVSPDSFTRRSRPPVVLVTITFRTWQPGRMWKESSPQPRRIILPFTVTPSRYTSPSATPSATIRSPPTVMSFNVTSRALTIRFPSWSPEYIPSRFTNPAIRSRVTITSARVMEAPGRRFPFLSPSTYPASLMAAIYPLAHPEIAPSSAKPGASSPSSKPKTRARAEKASCRVMGASGLIRPSSSPSKIPCAARRRILSVHHSPWGRSEKVFSAAAR